MRVNDERKRQKFMTQKSAKIPLYIKILIGMFAGLIFGLVSVWMGVDSSVIADWITPFGDVFMRLLKLIAVPLVFLSLISGVGNLGDIRKLSSLGLRTIGTYICTTIVAVLLGLVLVNLINPGSVVDRSTAGAIADANQSVVAHSVGVVERIESVSPLKFLVDVVPDNMMGAMSSNSAMLQIIFIAVLIGVAVLAVGREKSAPFVAVVNSLNSIVLKIIDIVMSAAPFGVFALMATMVAQSAGNMSLLGALGLYAATVVLGLLLMIGAVYPLMIKWFTDMPIGRFFRLAWPVQLLAFTTSSSAATLPLTMKQTIEGLGVSEKTASFVLPVGVTINMDGTSLYQAVAAVFIAQVFGIELSFLQMLTIVATTTISSIGTPGIPGGSVVMLLMVLASVGIPAEGLALILGLDRPLDMLRTVVNVTGDMTVVQIVDKS